MFWTVALFQQPANTFQNHKVFRVVKITSGSVIYLESFSFWIRYGLVYKIDSYFAFFADKSPVICVGCFVVIKIQRFKNVAEIVFCNHRASYLGCIRPYSVITPSCSINKKGVESLRVLIATAGYHTLPYNKH